LGKTQTTLQIKPSSRIFLIAKVLIINSDAETNRKREFDACVAIQRHWKGRICREQIESLRNVVVRIQTSMQHFMNRQKAIRDAKKQRELARKKFFYDKACLIQKMLF
jgi:hypothetical protein